MKYVQHVRFDIDVPTTLQRLRTFNQFQDQFNINYSNESMA